MKPSPDDDDHDMQFDKNGRISPYVLVYSGG